jgi:hypothetical protein
LALVTPKQKVTDEQARARQKADGFEINGETYIKPDRFKRWVPTYRERAVLKSGMIQRPWRGNSAVSRASPGTMPSIFAPCADWHQSDPGERVKLVLRP